MLVDSWDSFASVSHIFLLCKALTEPLLYPRHPGKGRKSHSVLLTFPVQRQGSWRESAGSREQDPCTNAVL